MILRLNVVASVIILTVVCLCKRSTAQSNQIPSTPCPDVFQYSRRGNDVIGLITVNDVSYGRTKVAIELSQNGYMELSNPGQLLLNFNKDKIYEYINAGRPLTYRVNFPVQNVIPRVTSIEVNGYQICSGPAYDSPKTTMKLEHTINVFSSGSNFQQRPVPSFNAIHPSRTDFSQGSNLGSNLPEFFKYSQSFKQQMSSHSSTQPSFAQPSFNPPSFTRQPFKQPSFSQPAHTPPSLFSQPSFNPTSSFSQRQYNFPSFRKPSFTPPPFEEFPFASSTERPFDSLTPAVPSNNQQHSEFSANPQNPFLNNSKGIDAYRPVGVFGPRNPPPTFAPPPTPDSPTDTPTIAPSPSPSFDIDIRNPEPTPSPVPEAASTDRATFDYINSVCGRENMNLDVNKLNVKGTVISKSRFPWIVAVFRRNNDDLDFRCGGSLISTRTVVSAAHCFFLGFEAVKAEDILISMGRHNLTDWLDANNIDAEGLVLHPDYRPSQTNFDADLAIVRLKASVTFTTSVRPICMWQGNKDAREIVGMSGVIVGWGSDGRRNTTTVPTLVKATVVAEITCIRSNDQFVSLTSNRTLCAGNLDGSGPCMGDSGNGLMIRNRNKWMLRGTVSAAIGSPTRQCVLDDYAIYSDIAMFIEWIRSNMLL